MGELIKMGAFLNGFGFTSFILGFVLNINEPIRAVMAVIGALFMLAKTIDFCVTRYDAMKSRRVDRIARERELNIEKKSLMQNPKQIPLVCQ